jgi:pSer/pThr/pTyr-binding forkhead associated (FHA) protein
VTHTHCPECGFQNPESANYCSKCGTLLIREETPHQTVSFVPDEDADENGFTLTDIRIEGKALVVRSGGGRAGETFSLDSDRMMIGRSPECDIFLDDVTVSRRHALVIRSGHGSTIEDLGSLNGTYVNRRRVEKAQLEDGDEVQIGKYRLTFLDH